MTELSVSRLIHRITINIMRPDGTMIIQKQVPLDLEFHATYKSMRMYACNLL
jgi:hypothetical protein